MLATAITLSLVATGAQAAGKVDLHKRDIAQLKQQYQSTVATRGVANMAHARHAQFMRADASSTLLMRAQRADHGVRNYRYDQTWRGIPIFGEGVVVSEDGAGNVRTMFGNLFSGLDQDIASTTPKMGKAAALVAGKTPEQVEAELVRIIPHEFMLHAHHWLILHGRYVCKARKPECPLCVIADLCKSAEKTTSIPAPLVPLEVSG